MHVSRPLSKPTCMLALGKAGILPGMDTLIQTCEPGYRE
jgi:hypothetical protein